MFAVGPLEILIMLLLMLALAFVAAVLIRRSTSGGSPEDVLDRRYASGELTREEYLNIRDDMKREQNA